MDMKRRGVGSGDLSMVQQAACHAINLPSWYTVDILSFFRLGEITKN